MFKNFCMDCGMLLSPNTSVCAVCGFDNNKKNDDDYSDIPFDINQLIYLNEKFIPENYPGY